MIEFLMKEKQSITSHRKDYSKSSLDEANVDRDPIKQFDLWLDAAAKDEVPEPHAFTLSTVSDMGAPAARIVLLREFDDNGFTFFTNYKSSKSEQLLKNPNAAMTFFWQPQERQVRVEGKVEKLSAEKSDEYFSTRPFGSKIGAWVSAQSTVIESRSHLEKLYQEQFQKYSNKEVPRPEFWGGYILKPSKIEFWQGRSNRLHDRLLYTASPTGWVIQRLAP